MAEQYDQIRGMRPLRRDRRRILRHLPVRGYRLVSAQQAVMDGLAW